MAKDNQGRGTGRSYYGEVSDRLRRFLGLDGAWPVEIASQVVPTINVGDATLPGLNPFVGRRFGFSFQGAIAAGGIEGIQAATSRGLLIDSFVLYSLTAAEFQFRAGPMPVFGGGDTSMIIDNGSAAGPERAGCFRATGVVAGSVVIGGAKLPANGQAELLSGGGVYLPQNAVLVVQALAGGPTIQLSIWGRIPVEL